MSDKYTLHLENFRSIRDATVEIAPLTVIYGANGTGKSSLIYGLLTLRNFFTNPAQNVPSLFSYPTISLGGLREVVGGLREVVRNHLEEDSVSLSLGIVKKDWSSAVTLSIGESGGAVGVELKSLQEYEPLVQMSLDVPLPYHGDQQTYVIDDVLWFTPDGEPNWSPVQLTWNGFNVGIGREDHGIDSAAVASHLTYANSSIELARGTGFVPLKRGFASPVYGVTNVTPSLATDAEVASLLATDRYLEYVLIRSASAPSVTI